MAGRTLATVGPVTFVVAPGINRHRHVHGRARAVHGGLSVERHRARAGRDRPRHVRRAGHAGARRARDRPERACTHRPDAHPPRPRRGRRSPGRRVPTGDRLGPRTRGPPPCRASPAGRERHPRLWGGSHGHVVRPRGTRSLGSAPGLRRRHIVGSGRAVAAWPSTPRDTPRTIWRSSTPPPASSSPATPWASTSPLCPSCGRRRPRRTSTSSWRWRASSGSARSTPRPCSSHISGRSRMSIGPATSP